MKIKTKILTFLSSILLTSCFSSSLINHNQAKINKSDNEKQKQKNINSNSPSVLWITIKAGIIGADRGEVTILTKEDGTSRIIACSNDFLASGVFDFNGGRFYYNGNFYTITEIDDGHFFHH